MVLRHSYRGIVKFFLFESFERSYAVAAGRQTVLPPLNKGVPAHATPLMGPRRFWIHECTCSR